MAPRKKTSRTKPIPIKDAEKHDLTQEPLQRVIHPDENRHYELHIEAPHVPGHGPKIHAAATPLKPRGKRSHKTHEPLKKGNAFHEMRHEAPHGAPWTRRIWNFLEWIAVSALIFIVFFFAMNWQSYSELIKLKIDNMTGNFKLNPFIEELLKTETPATQELLPLAATPQQTLSQIPPLKLEIAPPDERIIIPRINKNVPIVAVSTENLIRRDWGALESDIQEALRDGVVHYPGTAQAGETGNVVITGHSSYFAWDPGRFKDVFALLHEVVVGDDIIVYRNQKPYRYKVYDTQVVSPDKVQVLTQEGDDRLTLITCTPVGTNLRRLIVFARPIR